MAVSNYDLRVQGMIKMYNAEVLSKFPVVQHFPFGSLFSWTADPNAPKIQASVHTSSQPKAVTPSNSAPTARRTGPQHALRDPLAESSMNAPPSRLSQPPLRDPLAAGSGMPMTAAPWAKASGPNVPAGPNQPTRAPWASSTQTPAPPPGASSTRLPPPSEGTAAPWASSTRVPPPPPGASSTRLPPPGTGTAAPWATGGDTGAPSPR
ncbi:Serine/threonine-protein phosphatase 2A activator 1 [Didymella sp. IMI 355093]|nr:Serine/threonine-protein phosphatase 2A activator 1 [Didymella sp. IMI 355093]